MKCIVESSGSVEKSKEVSQNVQLKKVDSTFADLQMDKKTRPFLDRFHDTSKQLKTEKQMFSAHTISKMLFVQRLEVSSWQNSIWLLKTFPQAKKQMFGEHTIS